MKGAKGSQIYYPNIHMGFPGGSVVKNPPAMQETWSGSLSQKDSQEKEMTTHSRTLAWKNPWMEEPGRLQSTGSQRVGRLSDFHFTMCIC